MLKFICITLFIFFPLNSNAYIPSAKGLVKLITAKRAKGLRSTPYRIRQRIYFFKPFKESFFEEVVFVYKDRIKITTPELRQRIIYDALKKTVYKYGEGKASSLRRYTQSHSSGWVFPMLLLKNNETLTAFFEKIFFRLEKGRVSLIRMEGRPHYFVYSDENKALSRAQDLVPNMAVSQNSFFIKQLKLGQGTLVQMQDYVRSGGFYYPKKQWMFWKNKKVFVKTIRVQRASLRGFNRPPSFDKGGLQKIGVDKDLREFYRTFR